MITHYKEFEIHINNDLNYTLNSTDNDIEYDKIYIDTNNDYRSNPKIGIRIFKDQALISSAIICKADFTTSISERSFLLFDNAIYICCGDTVWALTIPDLDLIWQKQLDWAICFAIFNFDGDLLVHGEMTISRIKPNGDIVWEFSAKDIFVNLNGHKEFEIIGQNIKLVDFENYEYVINGNGMLISERLL